jgi:hypothetical protein
MLTAISNVRTRAILEIDVIVSCWPIGEVHERPVCSGASAATTTQEREPEGAPGRI